MDNAWEVDDDDSRLHFLWTCEKSHHIFGLTIEIQKKRKIQQVTSFCLYSLQSLCDFTMKFQSYFNLIFDSLTFLSLS